MLYWSLVERSSTVIRMHFLCTALLFNMNGIIKRWRKVVFMDLSVFNPQGWGWKCGCHWCSGNLEVIRCFPQILWAFPCTFPPLKSTQSWRKKLEEWWYSPLHIAALFAFLLHLTFTEIPWKTRLYVHALPLFLSLTLHVHVSMYVIDCGTEKWSEGVVPTHWTQMCP